MKIVNQSHFERVKFISRLINVQIPVIHFAVVVMSWKLKNRILKMNLKQNWFRFILLISNSLQVEIFNLKVSVSQDYELETDCILQILHIYMTVKCLHFQTTKFK